MSVQLITWAYEQETGSATRKAVLLALANRANHDTGRCDPAYPKVAADTELSVSTVRKAIDDLVADGFLVKIRRKNEDGSDRSNSYRFPVPGCRETAPPPPGDGTGGVPGDGTEPEVLEPEVEPTATTVVVASARARAWKVDRVAVTFEEEALAGEVLGYWNRATGQNLRSRDWLAKIVMRIREKPEGTLADHQRVIDAALANPWWKGPPSPSVVYGNGAQFERSIEAVRSGAGRSVAEILAERRAS